MSARSEAQLLADLAARERQMRKEEERQLIEGREREERRREHLRMQERRAAEERERHEQELEREREKKEAEREQKKAQREARNKKAQKKKAATKERERAKAEKARRKKAQQSHREREREHGAEMAARRSWAEELGLADEWPMRTGVLVWMLVQTCRVTLAGGHPFPLDAWGQDMSFNTLYNDTVWAVTLVFFVYGVGVAVQQVLGLTYDALDTYPASQHPAFTLTITLVALATSAWAYRRLETFALCVPLGWHQLQMLMIFLVNGSIAFELGHWTYASAAQLGWRGLVSGDHRAQHRPPEGFVFVTMPAGATPGKVFCVVSPAVDDATHVLRVRAPADAAPGATLLVEFAKPSNARVVVADDGYFDLGEYEKQS
eukprot:g7050.t1